MRESTSYVAGRRKGIIVGSDQDGDDAVVLSHVIILPSDVLFEAIFVLDMEFSDAPESELNCDFFNRTRTNTLTKTELCRVLHTYSNDLHFPFHRGSLVRMRLC